MRIPLDYYRILSIPVKATDQQLEQAYSDRLLQQPRREYNEQAITARQSLIEQAYQVLSNPEQRAKYDAQFLVSMQPVATVETTESKQLDELAETTVESQSVDGVNSDRGNSSVAIADVPVVNPTIEIPSDRVIGALLILHELGEYELVLTSGIDYYNSQEFSQLQQQQDPETNTAFQENIILSLALAYMELGREQWHRQEYEPAALSSQLGVELLEQENLFSQVKQELELDLDKLRPYRVLELISQNPPNSVPRAKGFQLLQEMLLKRQGIEGKGQDRSGLSFDQFLCFIQQLRTYLTSAEQQQLFDSEVQPDSAIASYLAVYALLGRGFCQQQPELVLRAQRKLDALSVKQDVTWEQAVCALLLGNTEKAIAKVNQSQDTSKLNQILQHDSASKDLLPGICFYGEKWLHEDVLSQFVDLIKVKLTLKEYFANREVQAYLDELAPTKPATVQNPTPSTIESSTVKNNANSANRITILSRWRSLFSSEKTKTKAVVSSNQVAQTAPELVGTRVASKAAVTTTKKRPRKTISTTKNKSRTNPKQGKIIQPQPRGAGNNYVRAKPSQSKSLSLPLQPKTRAVPPSVMQKAAGQAKQKQARRRKKASTSTVLKGWLFIFGLIFGVGALGYIATKLFLNPAQKTAQSAQLAIAISQPNIELPPVKAKPVVAKPKLTFTEQSQQVIDRWLKSKSAAFGKERKIGELNSILAEPLLTTWRDRANKYVEDDSYREYQHQVKIRSAKVNPQNSNLATVEAEVKEVAQHYQSGQLDSTQSYDDNLLVRYQLIRQNDKWLIKNTEVLKTL